VLDLLITHQTNAVNLNASAANASNERDTTAPNNPWAEEVTAA
jgi:hypothetical protein